MADLRQIPHAPAIDDTGELADLDEAQQHAAELRHLLSRQRPPVLAAASRLALLPGDVILTEEERRQAIATLERAQARRWVSRVRAAGEAVPNAHPPAVTPDTVWSGDLQTLVELFRIGLYRVTTDATYISDTSEHPCVSGYRHVLRQRARRNGRTHVEP